MFSDLSTIWFTPLEFVTGSFVFVEVSAAGNLFHKENPWLRFRIIILGFGLSCFWLKNTEEIYKEKIIDQKVYQAIKELSNNGCLLGDHGRVYYYTNEDSFILHPAQEN